MPGPTRSLELAKLFPDGVVVFSMPDDGPVPELWSGEEAAVARAVPKRRAEFARGRACARAACEALGLGVGPLPADSGRAPVWPAGGAGSITHCEGLVAAAVGLTQTVSSLGLDAEPRAALGDDIARRLGTADELHAAGSAAAVPEAIAARLVFSAKEIVHKCIHPLCGETLDFLDVTVELDAAGRSFRAAPAGARAAGLADLLASIVGRYAVGDTHLLTGGAILVGR